MNSYKNYKEEKAKTNFEWIYNLAIREVPSLKIRAEELKREAESASAWERTSYYMNHKQILQNEVEAICSDKTYNKILLKEEQEERRQQVRNRLAFLEENFFDCDVDITDLV